ncbi:MAG: hypothetical protein KC917_11230, partial [Candidatus Omnitrophica bacterium]|nr:hypothetical protein [Candidatus Omnitrophota bacterium]
MKRLLCLVVLMLGLVFSNSAFAVPYHVSFDFNTSWATDYAPGWENTAYRHGPAPVGQMMQAVSGGGRNGTDGMRLIADSVPESWMWWVGVNPIDVDAACMQKQYNPWMSAWYYDPGWDVSSSLQSVGQI